MINRINGYAAGGEIGPEGVNTSMANNNANLAAIDPTYRPPASNGTEDVTLTAQVGEVIVSRPTVAALGPEFFESLNSLFNNDPELDPKVALKAATALIPKTESSTNKGQPGDLGRRINSAIGQGNFAQGGLIGNSPPRL
jgi:hypothetical protein